MTTAPTVTMEELELEGAELLPSRETLCVKSYHSSGFSFTQVGGGNVIQSGFLNVGASILSGNNFAIL